MSDISDSTIIRDGKTFFEIAEGRRKDNVQPATFIDIFGNLSEHVFCDPLNLSRLNLSSLRGCPKEIEEDLTIFNNPNLKSLLYIPLVTWDTDLSIDLDLFLKTLKTKVNFYDSIENIYLHCQPLSEDEITNLLIAISIIDNDPGQILIKAIFEKTFFRDKSGGHYFFKYGDHFSKIVERLNEDYGTERIYNIYKNVNHDMGKTRKVLKLL